VASHGGDPKTRAARNGLCSVRFGQAFRQRQNRRNDLSTAYHDKRVSSVCPSPSKRPAGKQCLPSLLWPYQLLHLSKHTGPAVSVTRPNRTGSALDSVVGAVAPGPWQRLVQGRVCPECLVNKADPNAPPWPCSCPRLHKGTRTLVQIGTDWHDMVRQRKGGGPGGLAPREGRGWGD